MGNIVTKFGEGFTSMLGPLAEGLKTGFSNLIYVDPTATEKVLSDFAEVGLVVGGAMLAVGIGMGIFNLVRSLMN